MAVIFDNATPGTFLVVLVVLAVSPFALKALVQYWQLRHVPGPWMAKLTNFWLARRFWRGEVFPGIALELDKKYGPVVAYGPNRVLFSDPAAVSVIFNIRNPFPKAESYEVVMQPVKGKLVGTIITERSEARVSLIKKQIIGAFSTRAMLDYEPHIDRNITYLMKRLATEQNKEVDLATWNVFFAMDTICQIAFSESEGLMERQADIGKTLEGGRARFLHWHNWQSLPKLEKLIFKNRWALKGSQSRNILGELATQRLQERMQKGGLGSFPDLLDRYMQAGERDPATFTPSTIVGLVVSTIHAGGETTSTTINLTLYYLLTNPRTLARLKDELSKADFSDPPSWTEVNKLRYLEACIKEAGRLQPLLQEPLERDVPENTGGIDIAGVFIPVGTIVAVNTHALNRNPKIWGEDVNVYRPERWLECDEKQLLQMEKANLLFSGGRRVCIGEHVAWIEMKKYLSTLLTRFDVELVDPSAPIKHSGLVNFFVDELLVRLKERS